MKDFAGNEIRVGDVVAIIYHPEAYRFSIEIATIKEVKGRRNMLVTHIVKSDRTASFLPDDSGELYRKIVKIKSSFPTPETENHSLDAIGQVIHVGDRVACKMPIEGGGNTLKGFEKGGIVTKITDHYVFYQDEITMKQKRKGINGIVVY